MKRRKGMKKRIVLFFTMVIAIACVLAVSIFASAPDASKECATLKDGTSLPIWDEDGDALIWYKSTANAEDGYADYDYIKAQASEVDYYSNGQYSAGGYGYQQVGSITVTVNDASYTGVDGIVVLNMKDDDVRVTTGKGVGGYVNGFERTFYWSKTIEYIYFNLETVAFQKEAMQHASVLQYINIHELTKLSNIVGASLNNCPLLFSGKTLDMYNTNVTVLNNGTFTNDTFEAIVLPKGIKTINAWSLQYMKNVKTIHIPETVTFFGDTQFKHCESLETVTGYKSLFDRGVINQIQASTFQNCYKLTSVDLPDSYTAIGSNAFNGCNSLTGTFRISDDCESLGVSSFQSTGFDTIIFSGKYTTIPNNILRDSQVKYVYFPARLTAVEREVFRSVKNKVVVFYTGASADDLIAITVNNYNGVVCDASTVYASAAEFDLDTIDTGKNYIVYGYNHCDAFYGSEHIYSGNATVNVTSYFENITICDTCTREECKAQAVKDTIAPLFTYRGYSYTEEAIGGTYSMTQCFTVNREALDAYLIINPEFEYGVVASGYNNPLDESVDQNKVIKWNGEKFQFNHFQIKVSGITEEKMNTAVVFCAYVIDGGKTYYLSNNETSEDVAGVTYNSLLPKA